MSEPAPPRLLWLSAGFVVWSSAFLVVYGLQALGCAYTWPALVHRAVLLAALGAHVLAVVLLLRHARRRPLAHFLDTVTIYTFWAALVSTVLTYGPAMALSACTAPP